MRHLPHLAPRIRWRIRWLIGTSAASSLLACGGAVANAPANGTLGAHVAGLARKAPARQSTYIVQFMAGVSEAQARQTVRSHGGRVLGSLAIIDGLAVQMPARSALALDGSHAVKSVTLNAKVKRQEANVKADRLASIYPTASLATNSWSDGFTGAGVGVAVIDTGIAGNMADFATASESSSSRVVASAVVNPEATNAGDPYGHGTHVAGIIAGNGWNLPASSALRGRYIGIAPKANLISVKAGNDHGEASVLDVINGLQFVIEHKAEYNIRVVNLSLSSDTALSYKADPLDAAVESAWFNGIVVVAAAGNRGTEPGAVSYAPANDPYVITVGSFDDHGSAGTGDDAPAPYSSQGITQDGFSKPDIMADGSRIVSTLAPGSAFTQMCPACIVGGSYIRANGTSMAAPVVSGVVALLLQKYPGLSPDQVKGALLANSKAMPGPYKSLHEVTSKPTLDHAKSASPADQGLTPSAAGPDSGSTSGSSSSASGTRSSWRRSSWRVAPESLTAPWAGSSWSCSCAPDSSEAVDTARWSWRAIWSVFLTPEAR